MLSLHALSTTGLKTDTQTDHSIEVDTASPKLSHCRFFAYNEVTSPTTPAHPSPYLESSAIVQSPPSGLVSPDSARLIEHNGVGSPRIMDTDESPIHTKPRSPMPRSQSFS